MTGFLFMRSRFRPMIIASGDIRPSLILVREIEMLSSAELASSLVQALATELTGLLSAGAIATLTPDRVRVRPLPLRRDVSAGAWIH
jgi:hypothetical protein